MRNKQLFFILLFSSFSLFAQKEKHAGVGSVSEIILPTNANIRNNFNLFYEIHISREEIPTPSFWYKIIFNKDCKFEFTLFPLLEEDRYDFFLFKIDSNYSFCNAIAKEKLISCNADRLQRTYNNNEQSAAFRSNLIDVKPTAVKANDAIYIEVFNTRGNDCGHILDFRTTDNSFIVKIINDKCVEWQLKDTIKKINLPRKLINTEEDAVDVFINTLCPPNKKPVLVSSIKLGETGVSVQKNLNYNDYSKKESSKYNKEDAVAETLKHSQSDIKTTLAIEPIKAKSTADLNSIEPASSSKIKTSTIELKNSISENGSRLQVDYVLFSLLEEDLKRKINFTNDEIKKNYSSIKKIKDKNEKDELNVSIQSMKQEKKELLKKRKDTIEQLKKINKLLKTEQKTRPQKPEQSIFAKSLDVDKQKDITTDSLPQNNITTGLVYKIQIGVYKNKVPTSIFKGLTPVFEETFPGGVRYSVGAFTQLSDALEAKNYIKKIGLTDAFIIAYYNGKKIGMEEAKKIEKQ